MLGILTVVSGAFLNLSHIGLPGDLKDSKDAYTHMCCIYFYSYEYAYTCVYIYIYRYLHVCICVYIYVLKQVRSTRSPRSTVVVPAGKCKLAWHRLPHA